MLAPSIALAGGPAVSGPNAKFSVEGGQYDDDDSFLALGSYTMPFGTSFGLQADGAIGSIDDEVMGGGGLHLFARDPSSYLIGFYGSYHTWDSIDIWRAAGEFEFYLDRLSLTGLAGYEGIDFPSTHNGLLVLNSDDDHFFGRADLAYYITDDFKISGGYRYVSEANLGTASAEYLFRDAGVPVSVFAKGDWGEDEFNRVTGGLKIYFGADPKKTLIRRHRTEDPQNYTPVFPRIRTATQQTDPNICEVDGERNEVVAPQNGECTCPDGTGLSGGVPRGVPDGGFECSPPRPPPPPPPPPGGNETDCGLPENFDHPDCVDSEIRVQ